MMRQIMALFDEYQSKKNAKHPLRALKENALHGFWNGLLPPIGYSVVDAEKHCTKIKKKLTIALKNLGRRSRPSHCAAPPRTPAAECVDPKVAIAATTFARRQRVEVAEGEVKIRLWNREPSVPKWREGVRS